VNDDGIGTRDRTIRKIDRAALHPGDAVTGPARPISGRVPRPTIARIPREQALVQAPPPILRSILWTPESGMSAGMAEHALFVTQGALREVSRHVWSQPNDELLGFLLGERRESPETGARYVLISATSRSSYVVPEESEEVIAEVAWHSGHLEARRRKLQLLGWYHSAGFVGAGPTLRDANAHTAHFPDPWQVGLIVAPRAERVAGGFFRSGDRGEAERFVPFFEVVDDAAILADGQKRSVVPWTNYVPDVPPVRTMQVAVARPKLGQGTIPLIMPQPRAEEKARGILAKRRATNRFRMSARKRRERRQRMLLSALTLVVLAAATAWAFLSLR
jgi:proteasome lid subunit RPN8/RPN11